MKLYVCTPACIMTFSLHYQCLLTLTQFHLLLTYPNFMFSHYIWIHFSKAKRPFVMKRHTKIHYRIVPAVPQLFATLTYFHAALNSQFMATHCV